MGLLTLVYVSSVVRSFKDSDLEDILRESRVYNGEKGISGLLLYEDGNFMQVLEGDSLIVDELHKKISKDPRHQGMLTLLRKPIQTRTFSDWKMGFKNIEKLTEEEKSVSSDYLYLPLNNSHYAANPNDAYILLESFKQVVR